MEGPISRCIGSQVKRNLASRHHAHRMLSGMIAGMAVHDLEEMAMKMDRMRHHCIVDQSDTDALVSTKWDRAATSLSFSPSKDHMYRSMLAVK